MSAKAGTYRLADGETVEISEAKEAWAHEARIVLERVAGEYHALIYYADLAEEVQSRSGIKTRMLMRGWIGDVLGIVGRDCYKRGEPLLSALCVRQDGTIGDGYASELRDLDRGDESQDVEQQSAEERLKCYSYFGATIPPGGGRPALEPQVAARRSVIARRNRDEVVRATCPTCHLALPATGQCDNCA